MRPWTMRTLWPRQARPVLNRVGAPRRYRPLSSSSVRKSTVARSGRASQASSLYLAGLNPFAPPTGATTARSPVGLASNPVPQQVPFVEWLLSAGSPSDDLNIDDDEASAKIDLLGICSGVSHSLVSYRVWSRGSSGVVERVLAMGNNEVGQLGLGYASQEPTRGLMGGFSGDALVGLACTASGSFLRVRQDGPPCFTSQ